MLSSSLGCVFQVSVVVGYGVLRALVPGCVVSNRVITDIAPVSRLGCMCVGTNILQNPCVGVHRRLLVSGKIESMGKLDREATPVAFRDVS